MSKINALEWFDSLVDDRYEELKLDFALSLSSVLTAKGIKKKDLAEAVKTSPAWITKVMRGDANLTLETMQKLASALEYNVYIHLAPKDMVCVWGELITNKKKSSNKIVEHLVHSPAELSVEKYYRIEDGVKHFSNLVSFISEVDDQVAPKARKVYDIIR